ncbi:uncharacterized protein LOC115791094 [Archocentrus centrarchus]|uniref:uncharacterized protein LOC115791094 n=1 Tax=Archocentrus centrarchus TaxID=63155 RepID=UPI0011EA4D5E|nr:uncharacterized protein LOC115791094 [Archocentrus centrarchus]
MSSLPETETKTIPSDEFDEISRSHLDMPLFTFPVFKETVSNWMDNLSDDDWLDLHNDENGIHKLALISDMSQALIEENAIFLLNHIRIQISANPHEHVPMDNKSSSADTSKLVNSQPLFDGCSYCRVTQDDVQSSFGDVLDTCFGQFMGTVQRRSFDSARICTLLSVEIAKHVNSALSHSTVQTSVRSRRFTPQSKLKEIAHHVINIFCICKSMTHAPPSAQCSQSSGAKCPCCSGLKGDVNIQPDRSEGRIVVLPLPGDMIPGFSNFEDVQESPEETCRKTLEQRRAESFKRTRSTKQRTDSLSRSTACLLPQLPKCSVDEKFLKTCLINLIDHITYKTHKSVINVRFYQILACVTESLVGEESYTAPKSAKNFHIPIYKELCQKFTSKYNLQALMEKCDPAFVAAFVETLKGQLKKSMEKKSKFKMLRKFRRNNKMPLCACETKAAESHSEENKKENRQRSGIKRICASIFSSLRNAFTCCITKQSAAKTSE